jgi:hypothetical protein
MVAVTVACAQTPVAAPAWMDTANWENVHPVAKRNIVYANVPLDLPADIVGGVPSAYCFRRAFTRLSSSLSLISSISR